MPLFRNRTAERGTENIRRNENEEEEVKFDGVVLDRKPSYYFIRKLQAMDESSRQHMLLDAGSSVSQHVRHFLGPNEEKTWQELLDQLLDLIDVIRW